MLEMIDYCQKLSRRWGYLLNGDSEEVESIAYEALGELAIQSGIDIRKPLVAKAVKAKLFDELRRLGAQKRTLRPRDTDKAYDTFKVTLEKFDDLVESCTDKQQHILRLELKDGLSLKEISEIVKLSVRQVQRIRREALDKLRRRFDACDNHPRWQPPGGWRDC